MSVPQQIPPLSMVAPSPTALSIDKHMADGRILLMLRFETVVGSIVFPLEQKDAAALGEMLVKEAGAGSALIVPTVDLSKLDLNGGRP